MTPTNPDRVDAGTVRGWLDQPDAVIILDVRTPAEFETAHIRGSYNLPLTLLGEPAAGRAALQPGPARPHSRPGTRTTPPDTTPGMITTGTPKATP